MNLVSKVRGNSWLFLRRAIRELISHDDSKDAGLTNETAVISTTFIQMAFELSLVAHFLKKEGIHGIVKGGDTSLSEEELFLKFENNEIITKSFNSLKKQAIDSKTFLYDDDESLINEFQKIRNKLVHLNYEFDISDLYDLKYNLTYFIVKVVIPILSEEYERPSEAISNHLDSKEFVQLINFPPYAYEMHKVAKENSEIVYKCVHCSNESLAVDVGNEHCYSCCSNYDGVGFVDCPYCNSKRAMIYDALNIDIQGDFTINSLCLNCGEDDLIYLCNKCGTEVPIKALAGQGKCHFGFCEWEE